MNLENPERQTQPTTITPPQLRTRLPRSTPVVIAGAALMLAIGGGGGAVAGSLITSKQIKNNTITSADIKNNTITRKDLAASARKSGAAGKTGRQGPVGPVGPPGATGPTGPVGLQGPAGERGAIGPEGQHGRAAWEQIPSGVTVVGEFRLDSVVATDLGLRQFTITLPGMARGQLTPSLVNFAPSDLVSTPDGASTCEGSASHPSAPSGAICLYVGRAPQNVVSVTGTSASYATDRAFSISWVPNDLAPGESASLVGTWAYTAP